MESAQIIALGSNLAPPWGGGGQNFYMGLYWENFRNLHVPSHKAYAYQILHVTLSSELLPREPKK